MAKKRAAESDDEMIWRDRVVGSGYEDPEQLLANPENWRVHPGTQEDAVEAVLAKVGWVRKILVNKRTGHVVDGHLRVGLAIRRGASRVPVDYVDLDRDEERAILATLDPLGTLAGTDREKLGELLGELKNPDDRLSGLLGKLKKDARVLDATGGDEKEAAVFRIMVECRSGRQRDKVIAQLEEQGLTCRKS